MKFANRQVMRPGERIRVLVVDDSVVIRRLVTHALGENPRLEVVGAAANGAIALERIPQLNPDVITLDIEMPVMDGMETLRRVRQEYPQIRVIMFSTLTEHGVEITLDALRAGADDYVTKASNEGSLDRSLLRLRDELIPRIEQFFLFPEDQIVPRRVVTPATVAAVAPASALPARAVVIGVSTGGPAALTTLLPALPASFPLPILVVQHMPPLFTRFLADRLNINCSLRVAEAQDGDRVEPGTILIAPGDFHMKLSLKQNGTFVLLDKSTPQNSCRPAVDALFDAACEVFGGAVVAVILTGMGQDGLRGTKILRAQGAYVIAQDEATSVVWGMPGAVVNAGLADQVTPIDHIAAEIVKRACFR